MQPTMTVSVGRCELLLSLCLELRRYLVVLYLFLKMSHSFLCISW